MKIKVKDKEFSFDGYVFPINSVQRVAEQCYEQGRAEGRKEAILWVRKLIRIFWKDWNKTSHKKLPYLAFEELDEHILEQADESNGREFMEYYKQLKEQR